MSFPALLSIILTLFLLMICGFFCRKKGIIDTVASKRLSSLIISVGQPMMIIAALNNAEYSEKNLNIAWQVTLIGFAMHTLLALASLFICRGMKGSDRGKIFEFSLVFANCGFIGFPILDSILGPGVGSFMGAFYVISFHLFLWTWGIFILGRGREDIKLTPKKILLNYGTVPCAIGVLLYLHGYGGARPHAWTARPLPWPCRRTAHLLPRRLRQVWWRGALPSARGALLGHRMRGPRGTCRIVWPDSLLLRVQSARRTVLV